MAKPWQTPTGRINTKNYKSFAEVVRDIRYCVFSVARLRPEPPGQAIRFLTSLLGSGFFVAPNVFLTCNHVMNGSRSPHQSGDFNQLIQNMGGGQVKHSPVLQLNIGQQLHLFPDSDAAILQTPGQPQPYASVSYADVPEGIEIGVAGYPLSQIVAGPNGEPQFPGVIYRVAKGVVTSTVTQIINPSPDPITKALNTIEVNFLFVPGNSGGPIFDAETGRVLAYVHGFTNREIVQKFVETNPDNIAAGAPNKHIESLHAVYSLGIKLDNLRTELDRFGVTLS
jgi:hypothetical protein